MGGIIITWDQSDISGTLIQKGIFSITIGFTNCSDNSEWACTSVYGQNDRLLTSTFWSEISSARNLHSTPWVICGDFNNIFSLEDKNKGDVNSRDISTSQNFLDDLNLIDPPIHDRRFTWTNNQVDPTWVLLDRFLYSHTWTSLNPRSTHYVLPRFRSNHSPICLDFGIHIPRPRQFRFEKFWYDNEHLENHIQDWWMDINPEGCGAFVLTKKIHVPNI